MNQHYKTTKEIKDSIFSHREKDNLSIAILPVGCIEQHGPYLPIETDSLIADSFSIDLAKALDNENFVYKYPIIHYSPTRSARNYHGTVSVDERIFRDYFREVCLSILKSDFDALVVVSGHGPADPSVREVVFSLVDAQFNEKEKARKPLLAVSLAEFSFALEEKFSQKSGRHADWREFLLVNHVLGKDFFSEQRKADLRKFSEENDFSLKSTGLVLGVPLEYRSVDGVIGYPLPLGGGDLEKMSTDFWNALLSAVSNKVISDIRNFFQMINL